MKIGSIVFRGHEVFWVIEEMREGYIAADVHRKKYIFLTGYGTPVAKPVEHAMVQLYLHRGFRRINRFWEAA